MIGKILRYIRIARDVAETGPTLIDGIGQLRSLIRKFQIAAKDGKIDPKKAKALAQEMDALAPLLALADRILKGNKPEG